MSGRPSADLQAAASLTSGQILAGRYRVTGFLGQGAVGEVYEARDLELDARIAVKILRPEIARDERVVRRFKQEIQLTHRVTHPNVCRTYDLVYHQDGEGGAPDRVFLTMELLRGETLEDLLARQGRLQPVEALPIVRQIAGALKAAHAAGVVHRDLKSANVFLVTSPSGLRAVVNDFGLAWSEESEGSTLTATGELIGSPAYMAPEQVRGETATPATDIYSFGVVLYEMVTGELPFVGQSAFYTALKRLNEPAPSPRLHVPDLDPVWDAVILRCLEREPAGRFATVDEVVGALAGDATPPLRRTELPAQRPRRWLEGVAGLCLLLGAGGMALLAPRADIPAAAQAPAPAVAISQRPTVAVVGFENLSGDPRFDHLGTALVRRLPAELAAAPGLRPIPMEEVDRARQDLPLPHAPSLSQETLARLHALLGADFVVTGSYLVAGDGGSIRYDVVIQDARSGATLATFKESGTEEDLQRILSVLGERLRSQIGDREPPSPG